MKNKKPNVLSFRVTNELMEVVQKQVESGNYKSRSNMLSELFNDSFEKFIISREVRHGLAENEKR